MPVRAVEHALGKQMSRRLRHGNRDPPRQSHVAIPAYQALASHVDRDQGARARRLHIERRTAQVELVSDTRGQVILVVGHHQIKSTHRFHAEQMSLVLLPQKRRVRVEVVDYPRFDCPRRAQRTPP